MCYCGWVENGKKTVSWTTSMPWVYASQTGVSILVRAGSVKILINDHSTRGAHQVHDVPPPHHEMKVAGGIIVDNEYRQELPVVYVGRVVNENLYPLI